MKTTIKIIVSIFVVFFGLVLDKKLNLNTSTRAANAWDKFKEWFTVTFTVKDQEEEDDKSDSDGANIAAENNQQ